MKTIIRIGEGVFAFATLLMLFATPARAQTYTCAGGTDPDAVALRDYVVRLVTASASTSELTLNRDTYKLPAASASAVAVETRRQTCDKAGQAYHSVLYGNAPASSRRLIVIKVANRRYVVLDIAQLAGEYSIVVVFDDKWQRLASFTS